MLFECLLNEGQGPEAENVLASYSSTRFFHERLGQRTPAGMYQTSLRQLWPAFTDAVISAESLVRDRPFLNARDRLWQEICLRHVENLLYVLVEHIEDCNTILKCCFADQAAFARNEYVRKFRSNIEKYRDRIGKIVNAIKHEQARLRLFVFHDREFAAPGYFVEGVLAGGAVGPNPKIHNDKASAAFSFAFDLRLHLVSILSISRNLTRAIDKILGTPDEPATPGASSTFLRDIGSRVARFTPIVFPDEVRLAFPLVSFDSERQSLKIEYPGESASTLPQRPVHNWVSFDIADGNSGAFMPPYAPASQPPITVALLRSVAKPKGAAGG